MHLFRTPAIISPTLVLQIAMLESLKHKHGLMMASPTSSSLNHLRARVLERQLPVHQCVKQRSHISTVMQAPGELGEEVKRLFDRYSKRGLPANYAAALALKTASKSLQELPEEFTADSLADKTRLRQDLERAFSSADTLLACCGSTSVEDQVAINFQAVHCLYHAADALNDWDWVGKLIQNLARHWDGEAILPQTLPLAFLILLECPCLDEPEHQGLFTEVMTGLAGAHHIDTDYIMSNALYEYPPEHFSAVLGRVQQYLTIHIFQIEELDEECQTVAEVLKILFEVNEMSGAVPITEFYNGALNQEDFDTKEDYLRWRKLDFSFCADNAFLYGPAAKARLLRFENELEQMRLFRSALMDTIMAGGGALPFLHLRVRRGDHLLDDTLIQIQNAGARRQLKFPLRVKFSNEDAVDEGGVQKELFQLLMRQLFDPSFGMFQLTEGRVYWFRASSLELAMEFELVGTLLGLAIFNNHILDLAFPTLVYQKLLGQEVRVRDLAQVHPEVHASFLQLLDMDPSAVQGMGLSFEAEVVDDFGGAARMVELCEGGSSKPVTAENREEYVEAYAQHLLTSCIAPQFDAFKRGFDKLGDGHVMQQLLRPEELELIVIGHPELDFNALESHTQYEDGYSQASEVVRWFWSAAHAFPDAQKRQLLTFVTGSDRVPIEGLKNLQPPFTISRNGGHSDRLPTAHTCFNHLLLPQYESFQALQNRLQLAIANAEGFGLR